MWERNTLLLSHPHRMPIEECFPVVTQLDSEWNCVKNTRKHVIDVERSFVMKLVAFVKKKPLSLKE
jgi:hypothetical protein